MTCSPEVLTVQFPHRGSHGPGSSNWWINLPRNEEIGLVDQRVWFFQGSLMSRRMLIYGAQQLSFRCRKRHIFEEGSWTDLEEEDDRYPLSFLAQYQPPGWRELQRSVNRTEVQCLQGSNSFSLVRPDSKLFSSQL